MGKLLNDDFTIRIPLNMIQLTDKHGKAWPIAFEWQNDDGEVQKVEIEKVITNIPFAEQKSGTVGDRYECVIEGKIEYLYYTILQPRKWFKLKPVSEDDYKAYYKLPGEQPRRSK